MERSFMLYKRNFGAVASGEPRSGRETGTILLAPGISARSALSPQQPGTSYRTGSPNACLSDKSRPRTANHYDSLSVVEGSLITSHYPALSAAEGSPITAPVAAFLIDTLPIRITVKTFTRNIGSRSNRHSSGPLFVRQNRARGVSRRDTYEPEGAMGESPDMIPARINLGCQRGRYYAADR